MALSFHNLIFFFLFTFHIFDLSFAQPGCNPPVPCNETGPTIQFPFWRKSSQSDRCGIPGYELSCNNKSETIINLPFSGDFVVKRIDYYEQVLLISDPDSCLPKRMENFTLSGSRFRWIPSRRYSFFNCSSNWTYTGSALYHPVPMVCLSGINYTVYGLPSDMADRMMGSSSCFDMNIDDSVSPEGDLELMWDDPRCWPCTGQGLICIITEDDFIECQNPSEPKRSGGGIPRSAKYGIIIGVGIPALLFMIAIVCHICNRIKTYHHQNRTNTELSMIIVPQTVITVAGLDGQTIESYPKTVIGESRRLPKPSDGTCPICLSEYQPKECLRTIPECNHYFHADCIDEWLTLNGTCPLCRNSLESLQTTPFSSMSSLSNATSTSS